MAFTQWVRVCDEGEQKWKEYETLLASMDAEEIIKEFLSYLDYTEERGQDSRIVKPITISCGRVMMSEPLAEVLKVMRKRAFMA